LFVVQITIRNMLTFPKFNGNVDFLHPQEFIDELNQCFTFYNYTSQQKLMISTTCLIDDAQLWARAFKYKFSSYEEFLKLFKDNFWGLDQQRAVYHSLSNGHYQQKGRTSKMAQYFLRYLRKIQYLEIVPLEIDFIRKIRNHFSIEVQDRLIQYCIKTNELAHQFFMEEDHIINQQKNTMSKKSWHANENASPTKVLKVLTTTKNAKRLPKMSKIVKNVKKVKSSKVLNVIPKQQTQYSSTISTDKPAEPQQPYEKGGWRRKVRLKGSVSQSINHHAASSDLLWGVVVTEPLLPLID
jgi:hypothetical protein